MLNAKRWAPPGVSAATDPLERNQYGAARGGPIRKEKTFFFASYSGLRQKETYYRNTAVVPTARSERATSLTPRSSPGSADEPPVCRRCHSSRPARPGGDDHPGTLCPPSNLPNNFYEVSQPDPLNTDEVTFKLDHLCRPPFVRHELLLFDWHRHPALVAHRQHSVGRSRLQVEPAQPESSPTRGR